MTLNPGDSIGPYEICEQLGEGGMATVYRAWHGGLHRDEALKVPHGGNADSAYVQRLLNEARMAAGLRHANVVAIHSVSEPGSPLPYFAMEWIEGQDLAQWLKDRGKLDLQETVELLEPVAAALDYAHARGVIHRDIKPANILLQQETGQRPTPKVVDFGISRAAGDDDGATRLTRGGMFVGTPEYMSPEQAGSGDEVGPATDMYSLGVLAYELLCGKPPFTVGSGVSRLAILVAHVREVPVPPSQRGAAIPPAADAVILKALSKNPEDRYPNCAAFVAALRETLADPIPLVTQNGEGEFTPLNAAELDLPDYATLMEKAVPTQAAGAPTAPIAPDTINAPVPAPVLPPAATVEAAATPTPVTKNSVPLLAGICALLALAAVFLGLHSLRKPAPETGPVSGLKQLPLGKATSVPVAAVARHTSIIKKLETVPFAVEFRRTPYLKPGQKKVVRYGKSGQREVDLAVTYQGKKELVRKVQSNRVVRAPQSQVVLLGSGKPVAAKPVYRVVSRPKPVWHPASKPKPIWRPKPKPAPIYRPKPVWRPKPQPRPVWRPGPPHGMPPGQRKKHDKLQRAMEKIDQLRGLQRQIQRNLDRGPNPGNW